MKTQWILFLSLLLLVSCKKESQFPCIDMRGITSANLEELMDSKFLLFKQRTTVPLEGTQNESAEDVKLINSFGGKLYSLMNHNLYIYNDDGSLTRKIEGPYDYFDIDTVQTKVFTLSDRQKKIVCYDSLGMIEGEMNLTSDFRYEQICCLGEHKLLLTTDLYPHRCWFVVDFPSKTQKVLNPLPESKENAKVLDYPLNVIGRGKGGPYFKYLFSDTVYNWVKDRLVPAFICKLGKERVQLKWWNKKEVKDNGRLAITSITKSNLFWIIQYSFIFDMDGKKYSIVWSALYNSNYSFKMAGYTAFVTGYAIAFNGNTPFSVNNASNTVLQINVPFRKENDTIYPDSLKEKAKEGYLLLNSFVLK